MDELCYSLMHRDDPVCVFTLDPISGAILRVNRPRRPELLPPGGSANADSLRKWWQRRAVPITQGNILRHLEAAGYTTPQNYLVKNLGLSLSDHYWIRPLDLPLSWAEVNLFTNDFRDPIGHLQLTLPAENADDGELSSCTFSPASSLQGDLSKRWIILDKKRCLVKGNRGSNAQESLNEIAASRLHSLQNTQPFVFYRPITLKQGPQPGCICESFTSDEVEWISAYDVVESEKRVNSKSVYEHFIAICVEHGLDETACRSFLEYQILTDFLLTNVDRHLGNFGVLRDTRTLRYIGMAPIFDSGNSMFREDPSLPTRDDLTHIAVNSFRSREIQLLDLVGGTELLAADRLPTAEELRAIYEIDPGITYIDSILIGYQKKIDLLIGRGLL